MIRTIIASRATRAIEHNAIRLQKLVFFSFYAETNKSQKCEHVNGLVRFQKRIKRSNVNGYVLVLVMNLL